MNHAASSDGGSGSGGETSYATDLSFEEILAIVKSDKENVGRTREQAEGLRLLDSVLSDMHSTIKTNSTTLKENYSSPADGALYSGIDNMLPSLDGGASSARYTADELELAADETDTAYERVMEQSGEMNALETTSTKELKQFADPGTGESGYSVLYKDITQDAREAFEPANKAYAMGEIGMQSFTTETYEGPEWTGPEPTTSLDDTYYGHYTDGGSSGGGFGSGLGGASNGSGGTGSGTFQPTDHSTSDGPTNTDPSETGPELQTGPGPTPSPGTGPTTTLPTGGNGPISNSGLPVGPGPGGSGPVKPVTSPANTNRTFGPGTGNAKPTPGMNRPMSTPGGNRSITSPANTRSMNTTHNRSLLPNQRQATANRNPAPGPNPARNTNPNAPRSTVPGGTRNTPSGSRGGVMRGRPNAGFEEHLYRNTRAGRTVPGVISPRDSQQTTNSRSAAPRVGNAGRVIGERGNKGRPKSSQPKLTTGSLTSSKRKSKKDTRHTWQRTKPEASTELPSGSVAMDRITGSRPLTQADTERAARDKRRRDRRELWRRQETGEAAPIPASELFDGTEGKVTRSVIHGAKPTAPVERKDVGPYFGTHGYDE